MQKNYIACYSCGKKAEIAQSLPPCEALSGWLTLSQWKGFRSVEHHYFCSFVCLQSWVNSQIPKVPEAFIKSFEDIAPKES